MPGIEELLAELVKANGAGGGTTSALGSVLPMAQEGDAASPGRLDKPRFSTSSASSQIDSAREKNAAKPTGEGPGNIFDDSWREFWLPALMGANPGHLVLGKMNKKHEAETYEAHKQVDFVSSLIKTAVQDQNVGAIDMLKKQINQYFPGKFELVRNMAQFSAGVPLDQWMQKFAGGMNTGAQPGAQPTQPATPESTLSERMPPAPSTPPEAVFGVAQIAADLRNENPELTPANANRAASFLNNVYTSIKVDKQGNVASVDFRQKTSDELQKEQAHASFMRLPPDEREWIIAQKRAGETLEIKTVEDKTTGMTHFVTFSKQGEEVNRSPGYKTGPSTGEALATKRQEGMIPTTEAERAYYEGYKARLGPNALPFEGFQKLQSNLNDAVAAFMPYKMDPMKGMIMEKLDVGEPERRWKNWNLWIKQNAPHYDAQQLLSKSVELLSALKFDPQTLAAEIGALAQKLSAQPVQP